MSEPMTAAENLAPVPPVQSQPPGRGAQKIVEFPLRPARNEFSEPATAATNVANTLTFDYLSVFHPFLNDDQPLAVSKEVKMSDPTREEIQAHIAASEARGETSLARLEGKLDTISATIIGKIGELSGQVGEHRRDRNLIIGTIVVAAIAVGGLVVGMATYGDALFGRGMNVRDVVQAVIKENTVQATKEAPKPQK
jgi:hypothetical protein